MGDVITVTCKHEDGWWEGRTHGDDSHAGFFPKAYVKPREEGSAPVLPPRPTFLAEAAHPTAPAAAAPAAGEPSARSALDSMSRRVSDASGHLDYASSVALGDPFSLTSLDAFDELMDRGFALDVTSPVEGPTAAPGSRVEVRYKAKTWDGAATVVHVYSEGTCAFTLGGKGLETLPAGLTAAVALLSVGSTAIITCAPHVAYGEAGHPPFVKPNSHIVFDVTLVSAVSAAAEEAELMPTGPQPLFLTHFSGAARHKKEGGGGGARVTSVVFDSSPVDDALIASAIASGLSLGPAAAVAEK